MPTEPKGQKRPADAIGLAVLRLLHFCRIHKTLRVTPAIAAGISDTVRDVDWIVGMIDAVAPKPVRPVRYKLATGTTDILNKGVTLAMADARKPKG